MTMTINKKSSRQDRRRLRSQRDRVRKAMESGKWFTLDELSALCGGSVASIRVSVRDLRKAQFGGHYMQGRQIPHGDGRGEYRMALTQLGGEVIKS